MTHRIIFLSPRETENVRGGIATWTSKILEYGFQEGFEFKVIDTAVSGKREIFNNYRFSIISEFFRNIKIILLLIWNIFSYKPALIHLNCSISPSGVFRDFLIIWMSRSLGIKTFTHFRGNLPPPWKGNISWRLPYFILVKLINKSHILLAVNKNSKIFLENETENSSKVFLIENFIEEKAFLTKREHTISSKKLDIIYVGAFTSEKGAKELIDVARHFKNFTFSFIGKISIEMKPSFIDIPSNINFIKQVDHLAVYAQLEQSDIFLFPSHSEGFPNAVLEAMSKGLPVVATNVGAIPEMIDEEKGGYLVDVGDTKSLIEHILVLSENPKLRKSMGEYNRNKAIKSFSYQVVTNKLINVYKDQINKSII